MELFARLPDDIKFLIITEFTGQFKMRNGNLIQQIDRDVINNMNDLFNQIPKPIVFPKNLNYRDIIYLNITNGKIFHKFDSFLISFHIKNLDLLAPKSMILSASYQQNILFISLKYFGTSEIFCKLPKILTEETNIS